MELDSILQELDQTIDKKDTYVKQKEEHIAAARRFYNASVNDLKNTAEIFPGNIVASMVGVKADMPFFEVEEEAKERIDVSKFMK